MKTSRDIKDVAADIALVKREAQASGRREANNSEGLVEPYDANAGGL